MLLHRQPEHQIMFHRDNHSARLLQEHFNNLGIELRSGASGDLFYDLGLVPRRAIRPVK
jgi:hypothetical protein